MQEEKKSGETSILNDSVVAGDVSIDNSVDNSVHNNIVTNNYSTVNNVFNDSLVQCHVCDTKMIKGSGETFRCASCGNHFCSLHFKAESHLCEGCFDEAFRMMQGKLFDEPLRVFTNAIENGATDPNIYYYAAICLLGGKKAFVQQKVTIQKIVEYMETAIKYKSLGIYYYFLAYIKYDYYERKFLNVTPNYRAMLQMAQRVGVTTLEINRMYAMLGVERPTKI